ncbi:MAG: hypothetical protein JWM27_1575 [Gemmatimonadetes bacterium]|nr:hypothetical protein [Gemmatimonadota bacterium]
MKTFDWRLVLPLGVLLGAFRIVARLGDVLPLAAVARQALGVVGTAGMVGVAVWLGLRLAPRADWTRAVLANGLAVGTLAAVLRSGALVAAAGGATAVQWGIVLAVSLVSGVLLGGLLLGFAAGLRHLGLVRPDDAGDARGR